MRKARHLPRSTAYFIQRRDGQYLSRIDVRPFVWSERMPLAFTTREYAERTAEKAFVGKAVMRERGIRVVKA